MFAYPIKLTSTTGLVTASVNGHSERQQHVYAPGDIGLANANFVLIATGSLSGLIMIDYGSRCQALKAQREECEHTHGDHSQ